MKCPHYTVTPRWIPGCEDFYGTQEGYWDYPEKSTCEDIDIGRYRCTQCKEVMYYTGLWKQHHEGGRKLLDERTGVKL